MSTKIFIISVMFALIAVMPTQAQADPIEIGTVVESSLSAGSTASYQLSVLETSLISIRVEALEDTLDPFLTLYDSSGNQIIANDDYHYPDQSDALLQAFVIPRTGNYIIEVTGFGDTSGLFRLSVLPGYDLLVLDDSTIDQNAWEPVNGSSISDLSSTDNGLFIETEGIAVATNLIANRFPKSKNFYFEIQISQIVASSNWQVGILFRYIDETNFYRLMMNNQGFWQLEHVRDDEITVVESWSTHPAIIPGETAFTLGVLTSEDAFDIIYNRQFIATVYDNSIMDAGKVGVTSITANAFDGRVAFTLENALMTEPTTINARPVFPTTLVANNYTLLARTLERQQVIKTGGEAKLTASGIEVRNINPGINRFSLASGVEFTEFVMGGTMSWNQPSVGIGGCGVTFNDVSEQNYTLAYINTHGEYGVSRRNGDTFDSGIYGNDLETNNNEHTFTVIVYDDEIRYYIDNQYVGTMPYTPTTGEIKTAVVNFDGIDTTCTFENIWLWSLDTSTS